MREPVCRRAHEGDLNDKLHSEKVAGTGFRTRVQFPPAPPIFEKSNTTIFFVGGLFGIMREIGDKA